MGNGLVIDEGLTEIKDGKGIISITNTTDKQINLFELKLQLEPVKKYQVHTIMIGENSKERCRIQKIWDIIKT